jgi:hypothetical protein
MTRANEPCVGRRAKCTVCCGGHADHSLMKLDKSRRKPQLNRQKEASHHRCRQPSIAMHLQPCAATATILPGFRFRTEAEDFDSVGAVGPALAPQPIHCGASGHAVLLTATSDHQIEVKSHAAVNERIRLTSVTRRVTVHL